MDMGLSKRQALSSGRSGIVFRNNENAGPIKITNQYLNYGLTYTITNLTGRSVYVKDRLGTLVEIKQGRGKVEGVICIEVVWNAGQEQLRTLMNQYERYGAVNEFCRNAAEAIYMFLRNPSNSSPSMRIFIDEELLRSRNDAIYQPDLDILLMFVTRIETEHPDSPMNRFERGNDQSVKLINNCGADALIYAIEAIDNSTHLRYKDKYLYIGDQVYHVPVQHKPGSPHCGFIITRNRSADEINNKVEPDKRYIREMLTFQEAAKRFGVADTVDEARAMGDLKLQSEARIAELQMRIKETDIQNTLLKRDIDAANAERDRESSDTKYNREREKNDEEFAFQREKWQREREKLDQDAALAREKYERERDKALQDVARDEIRNTYEWIKVLTGGLAILGTFLGLSRLKLA
jgi:hypothetical protein